jgi:hypothetical protein
MADKGYVRRWARMLAAVGVGLWAGPAQAQDRVLNPTAQPAPQAAEPDTTDDSPVPRAAPRIVFEQPVHDFGTVEQGAKVTHLFRFHNRGERNLRIESLKTSCGCTAAVISDSRIPPGGRGTISATFDTARFLGEKKKTVVVHTNDPQRPATTLTLQGEVRVEVAADPPQLYVGRLAYGKAVSRRVEIVVDADSSVEITQVANTNAAVTVQTEPLKRDGQRGKTLIVTVAEDAPLGRLNDQITVTTTSTKRPSVVIPIFGSVEGELVVRPPQVTFGVVQPGADTTRTVTITNRSKTPVRISRVASTAERVTARLATVNPGLEYRLVMTVPADSQPGRIQGALRVFTDHPLEKVLSIPLYGRVAEPAQARR